MDRHERLKAFRLIQLVWMVLVGGVVVFGAVAWALAAGVLGGDPWTASVSPSVVRPLLLVPLALLGVGVVLRRSSVRLPEETDPLEAYRLQIILVSALQEGGGLMGIVLCLVAGLASWIPVFAGLSVFAMVLSRPRATDLDDI